MCFLMKKMEKGGLQESLIDCKYVRRRCCDLVNTTQLMNKEVSNTKLLICRFLNLLFINIMAS